MKINLYTKHILLSIIALTMVNIAKAGFLLTQIPARGLTEVIDQLLLDYIVEKEDAYFIINKETGKETYSLEILDKANQNSNLYSMSIKKTIIAKNISDQQVISKIKEIAIPQSPLLYDGSFIEVIQRSTTYEMVLVEAQDNRSTSPQKGSVKHKFLCEGLGWVCPPAEKYKGESDSDASTNMVTVLGEYTSGVLEAKSCSYVKAQENANLNCINKYKGSPGKRLTQNPIINTFTVTCQVQVECFLTK